MLVHMGRQLTIYLFISDNITQIIIIPMYISHSTRYIKYTLHTEHIYVNQNIWPVLKNSTIIKEEWCGYIILAITDSCKETTWRFPDINALCILVCSWWGLQNNITSNWAFFYLLSHLVALCHTGISFEYQETLCAPMLMANIMKLLALLMQYMREMRARR